jgi:hypothetical protein
MDLSGIDSEAKRRALRDLLAAGGDEGDLLLLWDALNDPEAMLADVAESSFDSEDAVEPVRGEVV